MTVRRITMMTFIAVNPYSWVARWCPPECLFSSGLQVRWSVMKRALFTVAPRDVRLYRYRGHRYISTRRFGEAVRDPEKAVELAPASFDVSYHLGLAYHLSGEFDRAADEYARCMTLSKTAGQLPEGWRSGKTVAIHDDSRVAITDWRYLARRRAGRRQEAGLRQESEILAPQRLSGNQLATIGYAVANHHLTAESAARACGLLRRIVMKDGHWNAFGYIAAEAELARLSESACSR